MSSMQLIKDAIEKQNVAFDEFKKVNDERLDAIAQGQESKAGELAAKLTKIESDIVVHGKKRDEILAEMEIQRERIEELETRSKSPGKTQQEKMKDEYKSAFVDWVRAKGQSPVAEQKMADLAKKDVTIGSPGGGGVAVPEEIARDINRLEKKFSPVRSLVKVVRAGTSDYKELVNIRGGSAGWVGESTERTKTNTPLLRERAPTHGELYAYPQVSEWSLDDIFFNVESWLSEEVAEEFAIEEGDAVIRGNGTNKPTGLLNASPEAIADFASPLRTAGAFEFVPCVTTQSPAVAEIANMDCLIDLVMRLNSRYRADARWIMNSLTSGAIRKLKNSQGDYLWQPSSQAGMPDMLLGYGVSIWEQMDDIATNAHPVGFGNWRRAYTLADRVGLRITRDNITTVGFVKFYMRRREGGIVTNNDAAKFLKTTIA